MDPIYEQNEEEIREELSIQDQLLHFGHRALGLTEKEALEIDSHYRHELERPI